MQNQEQLLREKSQPLGLGLSGAFPAVVPAVETFMSKDIGKLAEALAKCQAAMRPAKLDSENPFFHSKYAGLSSVWDAIRKPMAENNLAVSQLIGSEDGLVVVTTLLIHSSGQWVRSVLKMRPDKATPQGMGSCLTYARRYALSGIVGVATGEDDDGNEASPPQKSKQNFPESMPAKKEPKKPDSIDVRRLKILDRLIHKEGLFPKDVKGAKAWVAEVTKGADIQKLTLAECGLVEDAARRERLDREEREPGSDDD